MNSAHEVCNARWDKLTSNGIYDKCEEPFQAREEADMKVHFDCYPDACRIRCMGTT